MPAAHEATAAAPVLQDIETSGSILMTERDEEVRTPAPLLGAEVAPAGDADAAGAPDTATRQTPLPRFGEQWSGGTRARAHARVLAPWLQSGAHARPACRLCSPLSISKKL